MDIVETGTTLRENDLAVVETVAPISARLIANVASFRFKEAAIRDVCSSLEKRVENRK